MADSLFPVAYPSFSSIVTPCLRSYFDAIIYIFLIYYVRYFVVNYQDKYERHQGLEYNPQF